ncbi:MAG TPA: GGDEF domain-containing protein [Agitococcus sp.]|nr:GGDEF domain-containing protein [Agitococcus sp.]HNG10407.1 GGDEF domain-containing protein [Agitococcus sp.]
MNLLDLLLSTDKKQRLRIRRSLLASLVFLISIGMMMYLSYIGKMSIQATSLLSLGMISTCLAFYLALRTGFNLRFKEPALTLPQILVAMTWICVAYANTGQAHAGTLMLYALVMVFGIFVMEPRRSVISASYGVLAMVSTMLYKMLTDSQVYPWQIEIVYLLLVVTILPTIARLSEQLSAMRRRLKIQKNDLEQACTQLERVAAYDELTGLINRRRMTEVLAEHSRNQTRQTEGFAIAMIDLDYFKMINDKYGHAIGDQVLSVFGESARKVLREIDILSRWGGEEFLLLMPKTNNGHPNIGIERLRAYLACVQPCPQIPELKISFSVGFTSYEKGESIYDTIKRADGALYEAKAKGRNCTVII